MNKLISKIMLSDMDLDNIKGGIFPFDSDPNTASDFSDFVWANTLVDNGILTKEEAIKTHERVMNNISTRPEFSDTCFRFILIMKALRNSPDGQVTITISQNDDN